jgi:hypothetical protein
VPGGGGAPCIVARKRRPTRKLASAAPIPISSERGGVGIRLEPAAAIVRQYGGRGSRGKRGRRREQRPPCDRFGQNGVKAGVDDSLSGLAQPRRTFDEQAPTRFSSSPPEPPEESLLKAGVLPQLKLRRDYWVVLPTMRPGKVPLEALAKSLAEAQNDPAAWRAWYGLLGAGDAALGVTELRIAELSRKSAELVRTCALGRRGRRRSCCRSTNSKSCLPSASRATAMRSWR